MPNYDLMKNLKNSYQILTPPFQYLHQLHSKSSSPHFKGIQLPTFSKISSTNSAISLKVEVEFFNSKRFKPLEVIRGVTMPISSSKFESLIVQSENVVFG